MATIPSDAYRAAAAPHDARATTRILDSARTVDYTLTVGNTDGGDPTLGSFDLYVLGFDE